MKNLAILLIIGLLFFASCDNDENEKVIEMKVASKTTIAKDPVSNADVECLLIWNETNKKWQHISEKIQGFDYEEGYEYILKVKSTHIDNPPMDSSNTEYTLIEIISKEKKESENLPE